MRQSQHSVDSAASQPPCTRPCHPVSFAGMTKLRKAAILAAAQHLSYEEIHGLKELFKRWGLALLLPGGCLEDLLPQMAAQAMPRCRTNVSRQLAATLPPV